MPLLGQSCTPKQMDLQVFLLLQLPYCVSMLLLKSGCKSVAAQYKRLLLFSASTKYFNKTNLD